MKIAPGGIRESDWRKLDLSADSSPDWEKAVLIVQTRIQERFIEPVDKLIEIEHGLPRTKRKYGFAILAIDCLVIETLQPFRYGMISTRGKSQALIAEFLKRNRHFHWYDDVARCFFNDFRCGILHQAETMRDSLVRSEGPLRIEEDGGIIINRTEKKQTLSVTSFAFS